MPRYTYGPKVKTRVKRLVEALLDFVNEEFEESFDIDFKWEAEDSANPKLIVRTTLVVLGLLTAKDKYSGKLTKPQLQEALNLLKDFLKILEDNRTKTQGVDTWHFTLTLWSKDKEKNLKQFEQAWESSRPEKSKALEANFNKSDKFDWRDVCHIMLEKHKRLTTNELLFANEDTKFELDDIHVPLALMQRTKPDSRSVDVLPEQGSQLLQPSGYEEKQRFTHEDFLRQVLEKGVSKTKGKRIALIGEPGAGKTTLLQAIAFWILDNNLGLPIWISLADLQQQDGNLEDFKKYLLQKWLETAIPETRLTQSIKTDFTNQYESGRVWLLLDGVDEIATGHTAPLQAIASQLQGWVAKARVVLTCRLNVWEANLNALEDFETYRLLDFDYPQQVKEFIEKWFQPRNLTPLQSLRNAERESQKGERLWVELDQPERQRIQDLVKNPLRLALLCSTWQSSDKGLPDTKAGLYQQFVETFYIWKENRFPTTQQQQEELNAALGRLGKRAIDFEAFRFRLRHKFVREELGDSKQQGSLFWWALQLGWLNEVGLAAESVTKEKVYAFYHPTFQEYFAALAIDDWDFFLPREHKDRPVEDKDNSGKYKAYRIFYPQWKEVILLWLGRPYEEVAKVQKEEFIRALVEFEDGCNSLFYKLQAYFLAATSIAEYGDYKRTDEILAQLIQWGFGNLGKGIGVPVDSPIKRGARTALKQTNHYKAIEFLTKILQTSQNERTHLHTIDVLVEINADKDYIVSTLTSLLNSQEQSIRSQAEFELAILKKKLCSANQNQQIHQQDDEEEVVLLTCQGQLVGDITITDLLHYFEEITFNIALSSPENPNLKEELTELLGMCQNGSIDSLIVRTIQKNCMGNPHIYSVLVDLVRTSDKNIVEIAAFSLIAILNFRLFPSVVHDLKDCITEQNTEDNFVLFLRKLYSVEVLWHCAQNMPYPAFYQAWHQQEGEGNTNTPITETLNQADLPQRLQSAIAKRCCFQQIANNPQLSQTIHLICIDTSKFINPDNPAAKIYTEMVKGGCPKCEDGTPKTMAELQTYWDLLESNKRVVLVFYEGKGSTSQGLSQAFLNNINKFDGAICVISDETKDDIPVKFFTSSQAIQDLVQWLRDI